MELFWALAYFGGAVAVHALASRIPCGNPIVKFLAAGGLGALALAAHLLATAGLCLAAVAALAVYAFACELYLFVFTMVASSVSARLLLLLRERERSAAEIQALYDPAGMVERRLDRLAAARLLERRGTAYRVSPSGVRLVQLFLAVKRFFGHAEEQAVRKAA